MTGGGRKRKQIAPATARQEEAMPGRVTHAVELREDEMVAIVVRAFFEVPEDDTTEDVLKHTNPAFRAGAQEAVRGLMLYWRAAIANANQLNQRQKGRLAMAAGLTEGGRQ